MQDVLQSGHRLTLNMIYFIFILRVPWVARFFYFLLLRVHVSLLSAIIEKNHQRFVDLFMFDFSIST